MLAKLSRLSGCPPARARRIASLSVVSAELSALRARRSLLMSRTLLTGSDNAAWQTRRSEPLRVQRLHQRGSPAVILADLRDERREIGADRLVHRVRPSSPVWRRCRDRAW